MVTLLSPSLRAITSTVAAALVVVLAYLAWPAALVLVAVLTGAFAVGWPRLLGLPALLGSRVVLGAIAIASFAVLALGGAPGDLVLVAALGVVAAIVAELLRRDGRPRLVESLSGTVAGSVAVLAAAGWLSIPDEPLSLALVVAAAGAIAGGSACEALHMRPWPHAALAITVATLIGLGAGLALPAIGPVIGVLIGAGTGAMVATLHELLGRFPASGRVSAALAAAVMPVLVVGLPIWVIGEYFL
ncbi:hypothetical protein [Serinibacter salmoneus]|uniref:Uncharacterized protein n=1 Tax=Serinibacter salmoneus TaxID=556530 RepID=A0A2A9CWU0_9MICO|nr:hypothetical protein [Serinibacter salmoneus]PFG18873.1 hypothetical protein ATL40_0423 [Serinibacter salmoneus]